jgi:ornithine cyclodeaminase
MNVVTDETVSRVLGPALAMESQRHAFLSPNETPVRNVLSSLPMGATLFKPSAVQLPFGLALGLKIVSVRPDNANRDPPLPTVPATIMMVDNETGVVSHCLEATSLTAIRTAAGSALATQAMLPSSFLPQTVTVFAAGLQAYEHLRHLFTAYSSIKHVNVANRSAQRIVAMVEKLRADMPDFEFTSSEILLSDAPKIEAAVQASDIIVLATNSSTPLFSGISLPASKTVHIIGVGSYTPSMVEVDAETIKRCATICVDSLAALSVGDLAQANLGEADVVELREQLAADAEKIEGGRITFFKSVGIASQDIAAAGYVLNEIKGR